MGRGKDEYSSGVSYVCPGGVYRSVYADCFALSFPEGWGEAEKLLWPVSKKLNEAGTRYYEGEVVFRQEIKGKGKGEVHCTVEYQCCNDYICMPPGKVELNVRIE